MSLLAFTRAIPPRGSTGPAGVRLFRAGFDGECRPRRGRRALPAGHGRHGGDLLRQGEQCRRRLRHWRDLDLRGHKVRVLLWAEAEELTGDAATNYRILCKTDVPIEIFGSGVGRKKGTGPICAKHPQGRSGKLDLSPFPGSGLAELLEGAAWIVDSLLGTGARGEPRPPLDAVIDRAQRGGRAEAGRGFAQRAGLRHGAARPAHHSRGGNLHVRHCQGWFPGPGGCRLRRSPARARHRRPAQIDRRVAAETRGEQA